MNRRASVSLYVWFDLLLHYNVGLREIVQFNWLSFKMKKKETE